MIRRRNPSRSDGVVFFVLGLVLSKFSILDPIMAAQAHGEVVIAKWWIMMSSYFVYYGIFLMIWAPTAGHLMKLQPDTNKLDRKGLALILLLSGLGVGSSLLVESYLNTLGYKF